MDNTPSTNTNDESALWKRPKEPNVELDSSPSGECRFRRQPRRRLMDMNTRVTATKPAGFPKMDAPQAKETYEKMSAATAERADLKNNYSKAIIAYWQRRDEID